MEREKGTDGGRGGMRSIAVAASRLLAHSTHLSLCFACRRRIWGTVIINRVTCPEKEHQTLWLFFRVLYWMIVGIWSLVLLALTAPVVLYMAFKVWTDRKPK